ncbi:MAG: DUF4430 domain-containing protein [Eubacteriales bacterium]|nr:DUF4430 domain-containing protein [Eubacteriales bacterium]
MAKKMSKVICAVVMVMVFCFGMAGCGGSSEDNGGDIVGTCTITVQDQMQDAEYDIVEGDTVYDILTKTGLAISAEDTGNGLSIEAIEGLANGDKGKTSGWMYTVNGEMSMDYCDMMEVNDGDEIVWEFAEGM